MPCKHVQILPGTQLLRKIMLCKMPPVITFDVYFYHKCFAMFYYKYYKLNLPFIFFTKWVVGRLTSMFYLSWRCWAFSFPFFIETFLVGPYSFQAKEGCILANLELVKAITKLEKFFFLCSSSGNSSGGSYVIKEYLWIMIPQPRELKHKDWCFSEGSVIPLFCAQNHGSFPEASGVTDDLCHIHLCETEYSFSQTWCCGVMDVP